MLRIGAVGVGLIGVLLAPTPVYVRVTVMVQPGLSVDRTAVQHALERGLFSDSLIRPWAPGAAESLYARRLPADSVYRRSSYKIALIRARITGADSSLHICLVVMNALAQAVSGPDTLTSSLAKLDSILALHGARYARDLVKSTWVRGPSADRCN